MRLDVPDEVRNKVVADGSAAWLDELPSVVESLAQDWSLTIGATLRGRHAALVLEVWLATGHRPFSRSVFLALVGTSASRPPSCASPTATAVRACFATTSTAS